MAKRKHSRKIRGGAVDRGCSSVDSAWTDVEQAFFASAPPDAPAPPAQPERFDDLDVVPLVPARRPPRAELHEALITLRRLAADFATAPWLNRRNLTIAIASFMLLVGLSAVVFASR